MTFIRYGTIQILAYALDMGSFLLLISLFNDKAVLANIVGKVVAGVFAFFLHRHFTFQSTGSSGKIQALRYFSLLAINIPAASVFLGIGLYFIEHPTAVKFASDVVCVFMTYWISKHFVFHFNKYDSPLSDRFKGQ